MQRFNFKIKEVKILMTLSLTKSTPDSQWIHINPSDAIYIVKDVGVCLACFWLKYPQLTKCKTTAEISQF